MGAVWSTCFPNPKATVPKQIGSCLLHLLPPPKNSCNSLSPPDPFVGATLPQMFVLFRPAPQSHEYSGCISVSNGDEGVACLKAHHAASKPPAFCPENLSTALFALGTTWLSPVGELFVPRQNAEWGRSLVGGG